MKEVNQARAEQPKKTGKLQLISKKMQRSKMGMGTLEVVIIMAALLTLALFFSSQIKDFAESVSAKAFQQQNVIQELEGGINAGNGG